MTPTWRLHTDNQVFDITNGTESNVMYKERETTVVIKNVNKKWAGMQGLCGQEIEQFYRHLHCILG